jgi:hypothetical protein
MALSEKQIQAVNSLDFKEIKQDLKIFLTGQEKFKDYDFEASGMSILLDILAYNTHHNAFYANMLANESFLDSAILRSSNVSLAKSLGYNPRSRRGAEILVDVQLVDVNDSIEDLITRVNAKQFRIIQNEVFRCSFDGSYYYFYATETRHFSYEGDDEEGNPIIYARNVVLREGRLKTKTFVVNNQFGSDQRFIIPDENLDDRSVRVFVRKSQTESQGAIDPWRKSTNILENDANSKVFFLQEVYDGKFEVYFGDGIVGKPLDQGNLVLVTYASCSGTDGNNIGRGDAEDNEVFSYIPSAAQNAGLPGVQFNTRIKRDINQNPIVSYGGQEKETNISMKFYAPRSYETQDRAVTLNDYIALLKKNYSGNIRSIHAWGGEDNVPPEYGKVFISLKPSVGLFLTTQEKLSIENSILAEKNIVSITPRIIDPDYLYITPSLKVKYDVRKSAKTAQTLENQIFAYVRLFGLENLSAFEKNFYTGSMVKNILDIDESIKSCTVEVTFDKILYPIFNRSYYYTVDFGNTLSQTGTNQYIQSSIFFTYGKSPNASNLPKVQAYFKDNGTGKITLYNNNDQSVIIDNYGSVDYKTGLVKVNAAEFLLDDNLEKYDVRVFAKPLDEDIYSSRNTILEMNRDEIEVLMSPVSTVRI